MPSVVSCMGPTYGLGASLLGDRQPIPFRISAHITSIFSLPAPRHTPPAPPPPAATTGRSLPLLAPPASPQRSVKEKIIPSEREFSKPP